MRKYCLQQFGTKLVLGKESFIFILPDSRRFKENRPQGWEFSFKYRDFQAEGWIVALVIDDVVPTDQRINYSYRGGVAVLSRRFKQRVSIWWWERKWERAERRRERISYNYGFINSIEVNFPSAKWETRTDILSHLLKLASAYINWCFKGQVIQN